MLSTSMYRHVASQHALQPPLQQRHIQAACPLQRKSTEFGFLEGTLDLSRLGKDK